MKRITIREYVDRNKHGIYTYQEKTTWYLFGFIPVYTHMFQDETNVM